MLELVSSATAMYGVSSLYISAFGDYIFLGIGIAFALKALNVDRGIITLSSSPESIVVTSSIKGVS